MEIGGDSSGDSLQIERVLTHPWICRKGMRKYVLLQFQRACLYLKLSRLLSDRHFYLVPKTIVTKHFLMSLSCVIYSWEHRYNKVWVIVSMAGGTKRGTKSIVA